MWSRMTDAIFTEEPIQFYSTQMKKYYLPPQTKMNNKTKQRESLVGKEQRCMI